MIEPLIAFHLRFNDSTEGTWCPTANIVHFRLVSSQSRVIIETFNELHDKDPFSLQSDGAPDYGAL